MGKATRKMQRAKRAEVFALPLCGHLLSLHSLRAGLAQLASILHKSFLEVGRESLSFEETVRLRAQAVAQQHDFRAIGFDAEMFHIPHQYRPKPVALVRFIDHEILEQRVRLISIQWIQAEGQKCGATDAIVYLQNKEEVLRMSMYLFDPIFFDIYRRIWSN
jgi:hypothetical protein